MSNAANQVSALLNSIARLAGCSAGIGPGISSQGPLRDGGFWGDHTAVLRACAAIGLSRAVESDATREDGFRVQQWTLSDVDGAIRGRVVFVSGNGHARRSSANLWDVVTKPPMCFGL